MGLLPRQKTRVLPQFTDFSHLSCRAASHCRNLANTAWWTAAHTCFSLPASFLSESENHSRIFLQNKSKKVDNTYHTMHATQDQYQECSECLQKCRNRAKANCPGLETWIKVFRTCGMTWRHDRDGLWLLRSLTLFHASGKPIQSQYALLVPSCALTSESILFRGWSLVWCALNRFQPGAHRSLSIWGREEIYISTFMCGCVHEARTPSARTNANKSIKNEKRVSGLETTAQGAKTPVFFYFHSSSTCIKKKHVSISHWLDGHENCAHTCTASGG